MLRALETRLPPPLLMLLLLALCVWLAAKALPALVFVLPLAHVLGAVLMLAGLALNLLPKRRFRHAQTTVNPLRPQATTQLVTSGAYRYTRNPMYLGYVLLLAGWGVWWQTAILVPALLLQVLWLTRMQIVPEERALQARFGKDYTVYCRRVRRWL